GDRSAGRPTLPRATLSTVRGPGEPARPPPRSSPRAASTASLAPSTDASTSSGTPSRGATTETRIPAGRAAIAARSLSDAAVARYPISPGSSHSLRKCTPSTETSVLTAIGPPPMTAQSSPGPTSTPLPGGLARSRIRRITSNSTPSPSAVRLITSSPSRRLVEGHEGQPEGRRRRAGVAEGPGERVRHVPRPERPSPPHQVRGPAGVEEAEPRRDPGRCTRREERSDRARELVAHPGLGDVGRTDRV